MADLEFIRNMTVPDSIPAGFRPGLLPRESKPGEVCPMFPQGWAIPEGDWSDFRTENGMIGHVPLVLRQQYGSCASESCVSGIHATRQRDGFPFVRLNPLYLYGQLNGGRDAGSTLDGNLRLARDQGCAPEAVWPYSNGWQRRPSEEAREAAKNYRIQEFYEIRSKQQFISALLLGYVVACGSKGHAVTAVHYDGTDYPVILNTWGTDWGSGGFGRWDKYDALWRTYGAFAYRNMRIGA